MSTIDFTGARGSNSGDTFHELWAVRQILALLAPETPLRAVTLEGLKAEDEAETEKKTWDGVDCALYFGPTDDAVPERLEICQLKYSASSPKSPWTVSRITKGRDGKATTSVFRRLAEAYKGWVNTKGNPSHSITLKLVTNQPVDNELIDTITAATTGTLRKYRRAPGASASAIHKLVHASGLDSPTFQAFARQLDLGGSSGSRFTIEDDVLREISNWADTDIVEISMKLRQYVRQRMLPESAQDVITRNTVLIQFGVSEPASLFPCPPKIASEKQAVPRAIVEDVLEYMLSGGQRVCLHGSGGVGKTTALQEIRRGLPQGSVVAILDCYGGGSYLDSNAYRHRPEDAFLQLSNDIGLALRLPLLISPTRGRDQARLFYRRLALSAATLAAAQPDALLVVAVDAADNSVTAAARCNPPESSFVHEFVRLGELPANVRLFISARTSRLPSLELNDQFRRFLIKGFEKPETGLNIARYWDADEAWIEDFHALSQANPRVQGYAIKGSGGDRDRALDLLRPRGKGLDQVFNEQFSEALKRNAQDTASLGAFCASLIVLPRPIPVTDFAQVSGLPASLVREICNDLAPGIRLVDDQIGFADEDFEQYVRAVGEPNEAAFQLAAANWFSSRSGTDAYAATYVAGALFASGQRKELLKLVENEPDPPAQVLRDPIRRGETHTQRLQLAIRVCREAGDVAAALKFVAIGAEAVRRDDSMRALLCERPALTARFARDTASRLILGDRDEISHHGPLLLHMMAEDARRGDFISVREGRRRVLAWHQARMDDHRQRAAERSHEHAWTIEASDAAASVFATLLSEGVDAAIRHIRRIRPATFALETVLQLIPQLLAEGHAEQVAALTAKIDDAWAAFGLVPLALAGHSIDHSRLARSLLALKRRRVFDIGKFASRMSYDDGLAASVLDLVVTGCELCASDATLSDDARAVLESFLQPELRRVDKLYGYYSTLLDLLLRAHCLFLKLNGTQADFLTPRPPPVEPADESITRTRKKYEEQHDREIQELVAPLLPIYMERAGLIIGLSTTDQLDENIGEALRRLESESWKFDRRHDSYALRERLALSLSALTGARCDPTGVMRHSVAVRRGWGGSYRNQQQLFDRFAGWPVLHSQLVVALSDAAKGRRAERTGAEQKSKDLCSFALMLSSISPDDASAIFQEAIEVASELDSEIVDQLKLIDKLLERAQPNITTAHERIATRFSDVIIDAAIRLEDHEGFPWHSAMHGLSRLSWQIALASIARWDDASRQPIENTLEPVLKIGLATRAITSELTIALLTLADNLSNELVQAAVDVAPSRTVAESIIEALAQDILLGRKHVELDWFLTAIVGTTFQGTAVERLKAQHEFVRHAQIANESPAPPSVRRKPSVAASHVWDPDALIDPTRLAAALEALLSQCRSGGEYVSSAALLKYARAAVRTSQRKQHLDVLLGLDDEIMHGDQLAALLDALDDWAGTPAIDAWARTHLPELLTERLPKFLRYLPWDDVYFSRALRRAGLSNTQLQDVLLSGLERHGGVLSSARIFAAVGVIGTSLDPAHALGFATWYIERLADRLPDNAREAQDVADPPKSPLEAVGRFLFAFMSDIDQRKRWRAAHAARRLARFGDGQAIGALCAEYERKVEPAFRIAAAPFYWIAARTWLMAAIDRIAEESPVAGAAIGTLAIKAALDPDFPHAPLQRFAKSAATKLTDVKALVVDADTLNALQTVNQPRIPRQKRTDNNYGYFDQNRKGNFRFDSMDTLPYWYAPALRVFADVSGDEFLNEAERWIKDVWSASGDDDWNKEPRRQKLQHASYNLTSNRHGSNPLLERYHTYLEWNALWCTIGTFLKSRAVTDRERGDDDDDEDELEYQLSKDYLTIPPYWLADITQPTPLRSRYWQKPDGDVTAWVGAVEDTDFEAELFPAESSDHIIVESYSDSRSSSFGEEVSINSALVAPDTGAALVRALQAMEYVDYYLPTEGHDSEIDLDGYQLKGWLFRRSCDTKMDQGDLFRNGLARIEIQPGPSITTWAKLSPHFEGRLTWRSNKSASPMFEYEAWGVRVSYDDRERYLSDTVVAEGHRLLVRKADLLEYLRSVKMDLIVEVKIDRKDNGNYVPYDEEKKVANAQFDRLFLLRHTGECEVAERSVGPWTTDRS